MWRPIRSMGLYEAGSGWVLDFEEMWKALLLGRLVVVERGGGAVLG